MSDSDFRSIYKTAIRTTRDRVIKPRPKYLPLPIWNWVVKRVISLENVPLGRFTEVTLSDGSVRANIVFAGQKGEIDAEHKPQN